MSAPAQHSWSQSEAVRQACAVLAGELGLLEGCISLASLGHDVVPDWRVDSDFVVFGVLSSDIAHLPFGRAQAQWSADALSRARAEIENISLGHKDEILAACRNVIRRFGSTTSVEAEDAV
jgi:hypothetical protein